MVVGGIMIGGCVDDGGREEGIGGGGGIIVDPAMTPC